MLHLLQLQGKIHREGVIWVKREPKGYGGSSISGKGSVWEDVTDEGITLRMLDNDVLNVKVGGMK